MIWIYTVVAAVMLGVDQLVKGIVRHTMQPGESLAFLPGVAQLTYVQNTGMAFGAFSGNVDIITVVSALLMGALIVLMVVKRPRAHLIWLSVSAIVAGGIGNLIDRIGLRYVVDYIDLQFMSFPVFNIADMWVVGGTILLVVYILFFEEKQRGKEKYIHWRRPGGRTH